MAGGQGREGNLEKIASEGKLGSNVTEHQVKTCQGKGVQVTKKAKEGEMYSREMGESLESWESMEWRSERAD